MPFEKIVEKITQAAGLSAEEIQAKITEKMTQLSGLISKEGAAHIIANELGVKLFDLSKKVAIGDLLPGMRDLKVAGKVVQVFEIREFQTGERKGKVGTFVLGDPTGQMRVVLWNDMADNLEKLVPGMVVRLENVVVRDNQSRTEIHLNDKSKILLDPEGEVVGDVAAVQKPAVLQKKIKDLAEADSNVSLLGTVVQIFDPRFFDRNRKKQETDPASNPPDWSYVLNVFLDDGSDNIRVVCFGDAVETLTKKSRQELMAMKDDPGAFEPIKTELLGQIVRFQGRVTKNKMFDRLEFIANQVERDLDPEKELAVLEKEQQPVPAASAPVGGDRQDA
ncbi:MAG: DUF2240 family protein [DPANN group archaeon]|nr:DUF2240 family protein [DPANN group archaeon]